MTTLITVRDNFDDSIHGRCDANCYNASEPECECICGGANHGAGLQQATINTQALAEQWLQQYAAKHKLSNWRAHIPAKNLIPTATQPPLFIF